MEPLKTNQSAYAINKRLVSRLFVIVNVTTIVIRQAEASSIKSHPIVGELDTDGHPQIEVSSSSSPGSKLARPSAQQSRNSLETNALMYLEKYGYMSAHSNLEANNLISEDSFANAIKSFQKFAGIPETGTINEETQRYMQIPRCGNVDRDQPVSGASGQARKSPLQARIRGLVKRRKRYALQGSKWKRQELTYRISQYPTRFNAKRHEVDAQIEKAFGIWSQVAPINFVVKREGRVHIDIRFASGDHGDGDAFDGPGNTLAHAYFPQYGGDAHFDDQEYWTIDSYTGTNIFQVAAHELGHSLGLGHSNVREALMAPFYQKYKPNFKLHIDDVLAIQALYGEKMFLHEVPHIFSSTAMPAAATSTSTMPLARSPSSSPDGRLKPSIHGSKQPNDSREMNDQESGIPDLSSHGDNGIGFGPNSDDGPTMTMPSGHPPDLCSDSTVDAITRTEDGNSYVFKGDYYWLLTNEGLARGYPRLLAADWEGLPGSIDAALTWADGKTFFFKGNKYWRFRNKRRDIGYPKLISVGFAGIPDDIDAAFVWSGNGRSYIFKGTEYWRFDSKANPPVGSEYPRSIKVWNGLPTHINAAFKWENNVTYFFKGNQYYRFNDKDFRVETRGRPPFPRPTADWWFGCLSSNLAHRPLSSSLKENQDKDWSLLEGANENTRIFGTHISDHKPASFGPHNETSSETSPDTHQSRGRPTLGVTESSEVSSSAISIVQFKFVALLNAMLISLTIRRNLIDQRMVIQM